MATLTITATTDYTAQALSNISDIVFSTSGFTNSTFNASQFGGGAISTSAAIQGDANSNSFVVNVASGATFSAAGFTFSNWRVNSGDNDFLTLAGTSGAETITGSSTLDVLRGGAGADNLSGGAGDDQFIYSAVTDIVAGESLNGGADTDGIYIGNAGEYNFSGATITSVERMIFTSDVVASAFFSAGQIGVGGSITNVQSSFSGAAQTVGVFGTTVNLSNLTFFNWRAVDGDTIRIVGTIDGDTLTGSSQNDSMQGGNGNDSLVGGGGDDNIFGEGTASISLGSGSLVQPSNGTNTSAATATNVSSLFSLASDANIANSTTDPHVSITSSGRTAAKLEYFAVDITYANAVITADIDATGGSLDSFVEIRNEAGQVIAASDDATPTDAGSVTSLDSRTSIGVSAPGRYYVVVGSSSGGSIANLDINDIYSLHISVTGEIGKGDDTLRGGAGNDTLDGGANGTNGDTADYSDASGSGVTVNLSSGGAQAVGGGLGSDTLLNIEHLIGSTLADNLTGDGNNNRLQGGQSADTLNGRGGADTLDGGDGDDTISFDNQDSIIGGSGSDFATAYSAGAAISINTGSAGVEGAYGSAFGDTINGSTQTSTGLFYGYEGNDTITGSGFADTINGGNGADSMDGGGGDDLIEFDSQDVLVGGSGTDFATAFYSTAAIGITTHLVSIEGVYGSAFNDVFNAAGQTQGGTFYGYDGDDAIYGSNHADYINGGNGNDLIQFSAGDTIEGGAGSDFATAFYSFSGVTIYTGFVGIEGVYGSALADTINAGSQSVSGQFYGYNGNDTIHGSALADTIDGGANDDLLYIDGTDQVIGGTGSDFATAYYSQTALNINTAVSGLEGVYGSAFNDVIDASGQGARGDFFGYDGHDVIHSTSLSDAINGGNGFDYVSYSGASSAYGWSFSGGNWLVTHIATGAVDTLTAVEVLRFTNGDVVL